MSVKELLEDEEDKAWTRNWENCRLEQQIKEEVDKRNAPDWDLSELNETERRIFKPKYFWQHAGKKAHKIEG